AEIKTKDELRLVCRIAESRSLPFTVLGFGSNILIADRGIRGLVCRLVGDFNSLFLDTEGRLTAGSGAGLQKMVMMLAQNSRKGMESLTGIPGSVGGAVFMNAGTRLGQVRDYLTSVEVYSRQKHDFENLPVSDLAFGYRQSPFQTGRDIIAGAVFKFPPARNKERVIVSIKELMKRRKDAQPIGLKSAGSFFKNPPNDYAARLIEAAGLKGARAGDAEVSALHAGFIVNRGRAKAQDVLALMKKIQEAVKERFGVALEPEVRLLGEFEP
ncbi:MAG: UDP-N-acetylmuramate dehydrogenase, partial [Elusimicrobia bacterium]|nr:UDP-N-acetylmuramate dehydrogenase [Elusimicrobiota bacterium]